VELGEVLDAGAGAAAGALAVLSLVEEFDLVSAGAASVPDLDAVSEAGAELLGA
jgi:hypothetical protein